MKKIDAWKIRVGYGIFIAAFTVLLGLLYIFECADIYYSGLESGGDIFSYEIVSERLATLLAPSVIWVVAIIVGYVLSLFVPRASKGNKKAVSSKTVKLLKQNLPVGDSNEYKSEHAKLRNIEISRIVAWSVCAAFALAASIISVVYLCNVSHFGGKDINGEILTMLRNVLPWVCAAFALCIGAVIFECVTIKRELNIIQVLYRLGQGGAPKAEQTSELTKVKSFFGSNIFIYVIRLVVFCVAVIFVIVGIFNGGKDDVLMKAINICTECIGLG